MPLNTNSITYKPLLSLRFTESGIQQAHSRLYTQTSACIKLLAIECCRRDLDSRVVCADCSCSCGNHSGSCWKAPLREATRWPCSPQTQSLAKVRTRRPHLSVSSHRPPHRPHGYGGDGGGDDDGGDGVAFSSGTIPRPIAHCLIVSSCGDGDGDDGDGGGDGDCSLCATRTQWWKWK